MELGPLGMAPWGMVSLSTEQPRPFPDFGVIAEVLARMHVPPDFQANQDLRYIHKRDGNADIYFVANDQPTPVEAVCTFRVSGKLPEIWDAVTGEMRARVGLPASEPVYDRAAAVRPGGSLFIVFRTPTGLAQSAGRNFPELEPGRRDRRTLDRRVRSSLGRAAIRAVRRANGLDRSPGRRHQVLFGPGDVPENIHAS